MPTNKKDISVKDILADAIDKELSVFEKALGEKPFVSPSLITLSKDISTLATDALRLVDYSFTGTDSAVYSEYFNGVFDGYYIPTDSGNQYEGEFLDGKYSGNGTIVFQDGSKYVGQFKAGRFDGRGTRVFADGTVFAGDWENGVRSGTGAEYKADGSVLRSGRWLGGVFQQTAFASVDRSSCSNSPEYYPRQSRQLNETGTVILRFVVEVNGSLSSVDIEKSSGYRRLDQAARKLLETCKFKPGMVNGKLEKSSSTLEVVWKLD
ncbi:MAG: TonB family protein [Betaproteobacteria bacterium]|nr:TonB family protein [Betaproteobacteria bacterium]